MKKLVKSKLLLFVLVLIIAVGLRAYRFGAIPMGLSCDEASIGYTSWLLLHTGADERGHKWPLKFESFGDWKQPGYIYLSLPIIYLLGLNQVSVRLLSLLTGLLMIGCAFMISQKIIGSKKQGLIVGLLSALLLTLNPWHYYASRIAMEAFVAAGLFCLGFWLLLSESNKSKILGIASLVVSMLTYHAALVFIPLWFIFYFIFTQIHSHRSKNRYILPVMFICIILVLLGASWFSHERVKATNTTIFSLSLETQWQEIYQYRSGSLISKLIHNQYQYYFTTFLKNYFRNWQILFTDPAGSDALPGQVHFYHLELITLLIGIIWLIKTKNRLAIPIISAILIALVPAAITRSLHTNRSIMLLPYVQILSAIGINALINLGRSKLSRSFIMLAIFGTLAFESAQFFNYYYHQHPYIDNRYFADYMKAVSLYASDQRHAYQTIYFTYPYEQPYIFYAFYTRMEPKIFMESITYYPEDELGFKYAKTLGNLHFIPHLHDLSNIPPNDLKNTLIISRVEEVSKKAPLIKTWSDLGNRPQIVALTGDHLLDAFAL